MSYQTEQIQISFPSGLLCCWKQCLSLDSDLTYKGRQKPKKCLLRRYKNYHQLIHCSAVLINWKVSVLSYADPYFWSGTQHSIFYYVSRKNTWKILLFMSLSRNATYQFFQFAEKQSHFESRFWKGDWVKVFDELVTLNFASSPKILESSFPSLTKFYGLLQIPHSSKPSFPSELRTPELHKSLSQSYIFCAEHVLSGGR